MGGLFNYKNSLNVTYSNVPLGLITDTTIIDYPAFYNPTTYQFRTGSTVVRSTSIQQGFVNTYSLLLVSSTKLYVGGAFRIIINENNQDIYNLSIFNPSDNTFGPVSIIPVDINGTQVNYTLNPNDTVRTIAQDYNWTIYIGGDFSAISYAIANTPITSTSRGAFVNLIGASNYSEFKDSSWSSDFASNFSLNTIIFKNVQNSTKKDIFVGSSGVVANIYTGGIQIYTDDYINLVVDNKSIYTLTQNGSSVLISSNEVCGKTGGLAYTSINYESFAN